MSPLSKQQMRNQVQLELEHIPRSSLPQNELRMVYNLAREKSLGKEAESSKTAKQVLQDCIKQLQKDYPDHKFEVDWEFFETH